MYVFNSRYNECESDGTSRDSYLNNCNETSAKREPLLYASTHKRSSYVSYKMVAVYT